MESSFARWRVATTFYRLAGNTSDTSKRAGDLGSEFGSADDLRRMELEDRRILASKPPLPRGNAQWQVFASPYKRLQVRGSSPESSPALEVRVWRTRSG